jgi:hypothetical protein
MALPLPLPWGFPEQPAQLKKLPSSPRLRSERY